MIDHATLRKLDHLDARVAKLEGKAARSFPANDEADAAGPRKASTLDGALASVRGEQEDAEVRLAKLEARIVALESVRR